MRNVMSVTRLASVVCLLASAPVVFAQANIPLTVNGNEATGAIQLPGGVGADLTITFEEVEELDAAALDVSASLVGPLELPALLARLGGGGRITLPGAFPVLLQIEPSPSSELSFTGTVEVSLHTHNLNLVPSLPFALHSAPLGGPFHDIMQLEGIGSYRAGGGGGGFSEFVIVLDLRPIDTVISGKFDAVQDLLDDHASSIPGDVLTELQALLTQAQTTYEGGDTLAAIEEVAAFSDEVLAHSGDIPNVWRAHDSVVNVAGLLRAAAGTLRFSLIRKESQN
jgi:hypothetical protein